MRAILEHVRLTLSAIRFSHSVFALPFALLAAFLAAGGAPRPRVLVLVVLATIGARTAAMAFNRLVDRKIDALNPRTAGRELPTGRLSLAHIVLLALAGGALFVGSAACLNRLCLLLSAPTLVVLLGYSFTKQFTTLSHVALGLALGIAPAGAWIAVLGRLDPLPVVLSAAVLFWTAGFDVLYALPDVEFDRAHGLFSIPARLGARRAIAVSRAFHAATFALLLAVWFGSGRGWVFLGGIVAAGVVLLWEQSLVRADDLSRLDAAFFTANGLVSVILFVSGAVDLALVPGQGIGR